MIAGIIVAAATSASAARAAELSSTKPNHDWLGSYVGGHFGYGTGGFGPGTHPILGQALFLPSSVTGFTGGLQTGNNFFQSREGLVLGIEADGLFMSPNDPKQISPTEFSTTFDYLATGRARAGYARGSFLPYVTGGLAFARTRVDNLDAGGNVVARKSAIHTGWTIGAGIEAAVGGHWTASLSYNFIDLGARTYHLATASAPGPFVDPKLHITRFGLNYHLASAADPPVSGKSGPALAHLVEPDAWSVHGQTTLLPQMNAGFRSAYRGHHSLPAKAQGRATLTATAFLGVRLWQGGEAYFNPELAQGGGLGETRGLGGFSNGEAQKAGAIYPKVRAQRYLLRQTFGLGGEQERVDDGPNQLAGKRDIDRITVTVGRFAVGDYFDANSYAHDPRADFSNWSIWFLRSIYDAIEPTVVWYSTLYLLAVS